MSQVIKVTAKLVLLGTGTPNPDPERQGPSVAVVIDSSIYIVDFGVGIVRRAAAAGLQVTSLTRAFLTHLHSDHTIGYPDLIFTPAIAGRRKPLEVFGPKGIIEMTSNIMRAYEVDQNERISGLEPAREDAYVVNAHEISEGEVYRDELVRVGAFAVDHGSLESYGYKFETPDRMFVISGDTRPSTNLIEKAKGCDILVHEVYSVLGLKSRPEEWQRYHKAVHTSTYELAEIANEVRPGLLVLYHQLCWNQSENQLISEISERYDGEVVSGKDLDAF